MGRRGLSVIIGITGLIATAAGVARAEDTRHKWQFGFGISYFSTEDDIRSDADLQGCTGTGATLTCTDIDPRPDRNLLNENSIGDDFRFDFSASYGFTRWFALEIAAGYFEGDIGLLENFKEFTEYDPIGERLKDDSRILNRFNPAGRITEIPLQLSALIRFRPESPFDPYFGAGVGYIFTDLEPSSDFESLENEILALQFNDVQPPFGVDGIIGFDPAPGLPEGLQESLGLPRAGDFRARFVSDPLTIAVNDGPTFHIRGGVDYYFNEHISLYVDGTYTWADPSVEIRILGSEVGAILVGETFLDQEGGKGADGFPGPRVCIANCTEGNFAVYRQAIPEDTCKDFHFSGIGQSRPECLGDDLNDNFLFDPEIETPTGPDLNGDGNPDFSRAFGVCIDACDGSQDEIYQDQGGKQVCVDGCPEYFVPEGRLVKQCISGSPEECSAGQGDYQWVYVDALEFNLSLPFAINPADDPVSNNTYIIQGGDIDLEGFSLGIGIKFTFGR